MDISKPLVAARRLLDDVLTHSLTDDQAIRVAEVLVALAVAEQHQPVVIVKTPVSDSDKEVASRLGASSKVRAAQKTPETPNPEYDGDYTVAPKPAPPKARVVQDWKKDTALPYNPSMESPDDRGFNDDHR